MTSTARLPSLRAVVLDARAAPTPITALRTGPVTSDRCVVTMHRLPSSGTHEQVRAARGVDVIAIVAGPAVASVAREARILVAVGARAAVVLVPKSAPEELERNARHLLAGAGLGGDDALSLAVDEHTAPGDIGAAVERAAPPRAADGFVVVGRRGTRNDDSPPIFGRVIEGALPALLSSAWVLSPLSGFAERPTTRFRGDDERLVLGVGPHSYAEDDEIVIASAKLPCGLRFGVADTGVAEPCIVFGGLGGWANGTIGAGTLTVDRWVCPRDGKVGVVSLRGASLGPVKSVPVEILA